MRQIATLWAIATFLGIGNGPAASRRDEVIEVPFRFEHDEILVQVSLGQRKPVTMMLDTDSDPSSVNLSFAQAGNFKLRDIHGETTGAVRSARKFTSPDWITYKSAHSRLGIFKRWRWT